MNRITVIGHAGKDPKEIPLPGERKMICFPLASTKYSKKQKITMWYECQIFSENAFVTNFVKKGSLLIVSGTLEQPRIYYSKNNNEPIVTLYLHVHKVDFLSSSSENKDDSKKENGNYQEQAYLDSNNQSDEKVPF